MKASEYQKAAHSFATYGNSIAYPIAGLAEEAGEVCGKFAKFIRKHQGLDPFLARCDESLEKENYKFQCDIAKELGDVLWMVAEIATAFDLDLGVVMQENIDKLCDRQKRGVIIGEGDNR